MGDLKPIGSEKLKGDEKLKRILELTYFNEKRNNTSTANKAELVKETTNGVYGIVKEKDGYYVKRGLNENTLDYIGGLFMKNKNKFSSYAEALKRLELIKNQEIQEATKYVLKNNPAKTEAPASEPAMPEPAAAPVPAPEPAAPVPSDDVPPMEDEPVSDDSMPSDESEPSVDDEGGEPASEHMKEVQRLSGKLGQALRDVQDKMESDDVKYVINMLLSAVDLNRLSEEDKEEIVDRFEPEEGGEMPSSEEMPSDENPEVEPEGEPEVGDETPETEMDETMASLEELINTDFNDDAHGHTDEVMKSNDDLEITPELMEINEAIKTTLSKYFE